MLRNICKQRFLRPLTTVRSFSATAIPASSHGLNRLREYYNSTLSEDLLVLGYDHARVAPLSPKYPDLETKIQQVLEHKEQEQPVTLKQSENAVRTRKGGKPVKPIQPLKSASAIPHLNQITIHAMVKDAIHSKSNLLSAFMAFQSVTGVRPEVIYARKSVAHWKLR
jgi:large subunit ribosomal protein L5